LVPASALVLRRVVVPLAVLRSTIMPAPTVALLSRSIRMNEPIVRFFA
jgi:hypothetical protein